MGFVWKALLVVAVFAGVGLPVDRAVLSRGGSSGTPKAQVRLAAALAGLFAGGAAASVTTLALAFIRRS